MGFCGLSSQARPWSFMDQWRRRIDLGWWVGLDLWVMDLWVCCVAMKPQTGGGGGCEGLVVVLAMLLWWSLWRSLKCKAQIGPHGEAQIVSNDETSGSGCCEASGCGFVGVVKPRSVPTAKSHLYLSSIMLYWEFWWVFGKEMVLDNNLVEYIIDLCGRIWVQILEYYGFLFFCSCVWIF